MKKNEIYKVKVEDITFEGFGVARAENMVLLIPNAIKDDVILAKVLKLKKNYAYAKIEEFITKSPARVNPECNCFEKCGGCVFRNISYSDELKIKQNYVGQTLKKIAGLSDINLLDISNIYLMTNDFYNSLLKLPNTKMSFDKIAKSLKTKNRTLANIKRVLLNIVLGISKKDIPDIKSYPNYIRILAAKKSFLPHLKDISIPYLMSYAPSSYKAYIKNSPKSKVIKINKNGEFILSPSIKNNIFANNLYYHFSGKNINEASIRNLII